MHHDIRAATEEQMPEFLRVLGVGFGEIPPPDHVSTWSPLLEPDRNLAAFEGDDIVGGACVITLGITVPGTTVPSGAVVGAAVLPTHRRRGLLRAMMHRHLHDMHDRGQALSSLWVSEWPIYGRYGYGVASLATRYEIDPAHGAFAQPPGSSGSSSGSPSGPSSGRTRLVDAHTAFDVMPTMYDRVRTWQVGAPERPPLWWPHLFNDAEHRRRGFSPIQFVVFESATGAFDGYAMYRIRTDEDDDGVANSEILLLELMGATSEAYAALWRFCLDMDLVVRIQAENRPIDDPIIHLLADGRRLRRRISDGMWIRLVDVPAALRLRHYRTAGAVTLRVHDPICPWNEATFRLQATPSGNECVPTTAEPDLELGASELAGVYLGTTSMQSMAWAGRVFELSPGALAAADTLFAWAPGPWCPNVF